MFLGEEFHENVNEFLSLLRGNISKKYDDHDYLPSPTYETYDLCMESLFISQRNLSLEFFIQNQTIIELEKLLNFKPQRDLTDGFNMDKEFMSIPEIIDRLLGDPFDIKFARLFVNFFLRILTREDLITILLKKFKIEKSGLNKMQLGVLKFVIVWLQVYPMDFYTSKLKDFLDLLLQKLQNVDFNIGIIQKIKDLYRQAISFKIEISEFNLGQERSTVSRSRLSMVMGRSRDTKEGVGVLDFQDFQIVAQLCCIESEIFKKITPRDYIIPEISESISKNIDFFNRLSKWTITQILREFKPKMRAKVVCKFMNICILLRNENNFNSLMSIIAALSSSAILRLSSTFKLVKRNLFLYRKYEEVQKLMDSSKGYHVYREALKSTTRPAIPYLGVFLRDFIYLNEFYTDKAPDGRINILKLVKFGIIVHTLMSLRSHEYPKVNNQHLQSFILNSRIYEENAYEISCQLEPRSS